jgi:hypothetical protein
VVTQPASVNICAHTGVCASRLAFLPNRAFINVTAPGAARLSGHFGSPREEIRPGFHKFLRRFFSDCCANAKRVWLTKSLNRVVNSDSRASLADSGIRHFMVDAA